MPDTGPQAAREGLLEEVKGRAKEAYGALTGDEKKQREGEAQQHKADAAREVAAKEAEAEKARGKAEAYEAQQRANQ
jgi:uncharacterized protein YjbJ (UPF0337 family)